MSNPINGNSATLMKDLNKLIVEGLKDHRRDSHDGTEVFNITRYVEAFKAEGSTDKKFMNFIVECSNRLQNGTKDIFLFESFYEGLHKFSKGNRLIKGILENMKATLQNHGKELEAYKIIYNIQDEFVREDLLESFNAWLADSCDDTRNTLNEAIDEFYDIDGTTAAKLNIILNEHVQINAPILEKQMLNEHADVQRQRDREAKREERIKTDILKRVENYLNERELAHAQEQKQLSEEYSLAGIANNTGLNLTSHIRKIMGSDASKNTKLSAILEEYANAIRQGAYEERLYETLIQNISRFNYYNSVDEAIKTITKFASDNHEAVTLTKILEAMRDDRNSYIYVQLVEEAVAQFVKNPNDNMRVQLRSCLMPFANDYYITEMLNTISATTPTKAEQLSERALTIKEQIDIIRENAQVENIYTPVQYVQENECIFCVRGQYYSKKGNSIEVLKQKSVDKLDESFINLSQLINSPRVKVLDDRIVLVGNDMYATVFEGYVEINGNKESADSLQRLTEMYVKYQNYDSNFYITCSTLLENFNNIARIDWAKRIVLNENAQISAEIFKLDEHIFIAVHNDAINAHTLYRNVNPIWCRSKLNEHMGINVSSLFSDMLPNQDKIILRLNETKNQYEESIQKYEDMIDQLQDAKEEAVGKEMTAELEDAIADAKDKLDDLKAEYKEWQKNVDKTINTDDASDDDDEDGTTEETSNVPLDPDEVEDAKDELSTPLSQQNTPSETDDSIITDDEFDAMINGTSVDDANDDDSDDIIDTDAIDNAMANGTSLKAPVADVEDDSIDVKDEEQFKTVDTENIDNNPVDNDEIGDEDDIFGPDFTDDENPTDEPVDDEPLENQSDDEDIITIDVDGDEETNALPSDAEMDTVDVDNTEAGELPTEEEGMAATDIFGGDTEDPLNLKNTIDNEVVGTNAPENPQVVSVMFDKNVNDNTVSKSGNVIAVVPMVSTTGDTFADNKTFHFYLNADNTPVIETDGDMPMALYNAIIDAIKTSSEFAHVCEVGVPVEGAGLAETTADEDDIVLAEPTGSDNWEEEYNKEMSDEDRGVYTIGGDDEDEVSTDIIDTDKIDAKMNGIAEPVNTEDNIPEPDEDNIFSDIFSDEEDTETVAEPTEETTTSTVDDVFEIPTEEEGNLSTEPATEGDGETKDVIPTYTDEDGTEFELPAADDDDTLIPEKEKTPNKKQVNENRKAIVSITSTKKGDKGFFVNEGTVKPSKNNVTEEVADLDKETIDGGNIEIPQSSETPLDNIHKDSTPIVDEPSVNIMAKMHYLATDSALNATEDGHDINVSQIREFDVHGAKITWFEISDKKNETSYVVYELFGEIMYRPAEEFYQIRIDNEDEVPGSSVESFLHQYDEKNVPLNGCSQDNVEDCMFVITSIFSSMTGKSYESSELDSVSINEGCKIIKHNALSTDYDPKKSKKFHDAKYGTKEENDFKKELEDKQIKDGTVGALDQPQQESVKPKLPNVNVITEAKETKKLTKAQLLSIEYEPNDHVLVDGEMARVASVYHAPDGAQHVTVIKNGMTQTYLSTEIEPDPHYFNYDEFEQFDFDENKLTTNVSNDTTPNPHQDLNDKIIACHLVMDGQRLDENGTMFASLKDISESEDLINVTNISTGATSPWKKEFLAFDEEEWPYAVIASEKDDEPIRKIRINPTSYINATDDDMVDCICGDKKTQFPKKAIKIIS